MDTILENTFLRVAFDINGNLSSIMDKRNNREYVKPHGLWRIIINEKESLEVEIKSENWSSWNISKEVENWLNS